MGLLWEYQVPGWKGAGWKGWRVCITTGTGERTFCFDERDDVTTAAEAMRRALADKTFDELGEEGIVIEAEPVRTLVSAEVNPN